MYELVDAVVGSAWLCRGLPAIWGQVATSRGVFHDNHILSLVNTQKNPFELEMAPQATGKQTSPSFFLVSPTSDSHMNTGSDERISPLIDARGI